MSPTLALMSLGVKVRPLWPTSMRMVFALATAERVATARDVKSMLAVVLFYLCGCLGIRRRMKKKELLNRLQLGYHLSRIGLFGLRKISRNSQEPEGVLALYAFSFQ